MTNMFAKDLDAGENGSVALSLVPGELSTRVGAMTSSVSFGKAEFLCCVAEEAGPSHFAIDGETGDISTTEHFAQNSRSFYTLRICARDGGAPPLEDIAVVHVQVFSLPSSLFPRSARQDIEAHSSRRFMDQRLRAAELIIRSSSASW